MGKVNVTWFDSDGAMDIDYIEHGTAYRLDEKHIIHLVNNPDYLKIEKISGETDENIIVDKRLKDDEYPIFIDLENVNLDQFDSGHEAVVNFAKYLLKLNSEK